MSSELQQLLSLLPPGDDVLDPLIIIPVFNNGNYLINFTEQLKKLGLNRYLVFDGGSSEQATVKILEEMRVDNRVLGLQNNPGPRYFFESREVFDCLPSIFCVSDPDLSLSAKLPRDFLKNFYDLSVEFSIGKVGMALDLEGDLIEDEFFFYGEWHTIRKWEEKYWRTRLPNSIGLEVYQSEIDTTFALYNKTYLHPKFFFPALRVAGDFTATHLPWLIRNPVENPFNQPAEHGVQTWTTWSHASTLANLRNVTEQYERRLSLIETSFSWRFTAPLRNAGRLFRKIFQR